MNPEFRRLLWKLFGASIDMPENAIVICPDILWDADYKFWYWPYHTIFYPEYHSSLDTRILRQRVPLPCPNRIRSLNVNESLTLFVQKLHKSRRYGHGS